ncbi:hypothetical protein AAVH_26820 [Aphelenchoides avenae]|nr:hypothetical protein AAVH_26820 [Aphelenchus avenae]
MFTTAIALIALLSVVLVSADEGPVNIAACVRIIRGICQGGILPAADNLACTQACLAQSGIGVVGVCLNLTPLNLGASVCVCLSA